MRKLEIFWFRYFSYSTTDSKDGWVRWVVTGVMFFPAVIGAIMDINDRNALPWIWIYIGLMVAFAVVWITVWFYHNWRIKHER